MWTEAFLEYLTLERNYSLRTVEEYRDDLNAFESYYKKVDSTLSWETIDGDVVRDWMVSMMEAGRTATTVNRRLSALRTFYRYLLKRDWIKADPVRNIQDAAKGAGIGAGIYKDHDEAFASLKKLAVIEPDEANRSAYLEAYADWKAELGKL